MDIHKIYRLIFKIWREKRMASFEKIIAPNHDDLLLDVGGLPPTWTGRPQRAKRIDCVNVHPVTWDKDLFPNHSITTVVGDACSLEYEDKSYDILFSNSVIEHVGDWERQVAFAAEVRRVGKKLWIQTPAFESPLEPHYLAPFVHWLPVNIRRKVLRWFTPWGWLSTPTQEEVDDSIAHTQLLSRKQFEELFPDCHIKTERFFGVFVKSYIAYRIENEEPVDRLSK